MVKLVEEAKIVGALGASKGGFARAEFLTPKQLSNSARNAVNARWAEPGTYKNTKVRNRARIRI